VQLSAAYEREHADAEARGWPTLILDHTHLAVRTHPGPVFDAIAWIARQNEL
jgi:hypothetical protein